MLLPGLLAQRCHPQQRRGGMGMAAAQHYNVLTLSTEKLSFCTLFGADSFALFRRGRVSLSLDGAIK